MEEIRKMGGQKGLDGLGFRDFGSFNVARLAKQGWRFIRNPNSLAAVVYKEKSYKNSNFLEAKLSSKPSLIWRSI